MYIVIIDEGFHDRKEEVRVFENAGVARCWVWDYATRMQRRKIPDGEYDVVDARLYRVSRAGKCVFTDQFSDVALKDGYAEGWKSEGRREAEHQEWEAAREAEREWRAKYVAVPIERHAD